MLRSIPLLEEFYCHGWCLSYKNQRKSHYLYFRYCFLDLSGEKDRDIFLRDVDLLEVECSAELQQSSASTTLLCCDLSYRCSSQLLWFRVKISCFDSKSHYDGAHYLEVEVSEF